MDSEGYREMTQTIKLQTQLIQEQLLPCFSIMTALVKIMPPEEQKRLLELLQTVSEDIEPLAQTENIESPYSRAVKIVSQLASGGVSDIASVQKLQLIQGGKKDT